VKQTAVWQSFERTHRRAPGVGATRCGRWRLLALAALAGLLLAQAVAPAQAQVVELEYWHFYSGLIGEVHASLVEEFNREHPHIRVNEVYSGSEWTMRDKLLAALSAGSGPDVAGIDQFWISQLAAGGHVVPVDEFIAATPGFDVTDVFPVYWETGRYNGRIWSMPFAISNAVMYYNKDLLAAVGLTEEDVPRTWDELLRLAETNADEWRRRGIWVLDAPTTAQTGVVYYFLITVWQHGGDMYTPELDRVAFDSEAGRRALALWQRLVETGILDLKRPDRTFESGRALFQLSSSARILSSYAQLPFEWGVAPIPYADRRATGIGGRNLAILTRDPAKQAAAWTFIQWMTGAETNLRFSAATGYSPLRQSGYSSAAFQELLSANPDVERALHEMIYARPRPNVPSYSDASRVLGEAVERVLYTGGDARALDEAAREANEIIERYARLGQ